jgi:hypothetical protein
MAVSYGIILITLKGTYDATVQYDTLNVVELDGSSYICKLKPPTVGVAPTNTTYWQLLTRGVDSSFSIDDLADVDIDFTTIQDKQAIVWDAVNSCFVAGNVADASVIAFPDVSPAESAHATGTYLYYNDTTYEVIDDISIGDTLTIGTNIAVPTLDEGTVIYIPETAGGGSGTAAGTSYDNTSSGLSATNVQDAIDEVVAGMGAQTSNRNLLDNPWFTVNQRGVTSGSDFLVHYTLDRWKTAYEHDTSGSWSLVDGVLTLTAPTSDGVFWLQNIENVADLDGCVLTASMMFSDGTIVSGTITRTNGTKQIFVTSDDYDVYFNALDTFNIKIKANKSIAIRAVKLEVGTASTLALDVAPNYTDELLRCQRYFKVIDFASQYAFYGFAIVESSTEAWVNIIPPVQMRITPTMTTTGAFRLYISSTSKVVTLSLAGASSKDSLIIKCTGTSLTVGAVSWLYASGGAAQIAFDAEIY